MIRRILLAYSNTRPVKVISDNGRRYLERYFVCSVFGMRVYLHRFVGSDPDRGLHDHPWAWAASIVLAGWYREVRRRGLREVRWFNSLEGDTFHRIIKPEGMADVWTLFFHKAGDVKPWGFMRYLGHGQALWSEYVYGGKGKETAWWLTAKKGRDLRL
ncbi:hypothetical protein DEE38_24385 [Ralstonia pickettii]|nr:hypothetical protein [Ralstonia pickettii]MBX4028178.1 hypothetical protein [Ralstonia pickettii]MBX4072729.1 hypothetical protein [Ralstonia pickettii]MBX4077686.1 hypothetical protein [Ralstonia pickettii]MBX4090691.1 hypothetical protein [Ralstonia pickettii]